MKPLVIPVKEVNLRYTKAGTLHTHDKLEDTEVIGDYSKIKFEEFNLASPTQVNKRLDLLGWKPYVKTATGKSYKICPENLATIPEDAPEAVRRLKTWKVLETRWKIAKEWLELSLMALQEMYCGVWMVCMRQSVAKLSLFLKVANL